MFNFDCICTSSEKNQYCSKSAARCGSCCTQVQYKNMLLVPAVLEKDMSWHTKNTVVCTLVRVQSTNSTSIPVLPVSTQLRVMGTSNIVAAT
jgi:hypothetical protein